MDIGDIIYFVILLVSVIAGAINKSKKKKEQQRKTTAPEPIYEPEPYNEPEPELDVKTIFEELLQKQEPSPQPIVQEEPELEHAIESVETEKTHHTPKAETSAAHQEMLKMQQRVHIHTPETKHSDQDYIDFDLRQAIIYNEIMNRPYS